MNDLFRFIGKEDKLGYKTGKIYMLELQGRGAFGGIMITAPIHCPYTSYETFFENWERV